MKMKTYWKKTKKLLLMRVDHSLLKAKRPNKSLEERGHHCWVRPGDR